MFTVSLEAAVWEKEDIEKYLMILASDGWMQQPQENFPARLSALAPNSKGDPGITTIPRPVKAR